MTDTWQPRLTQRPSMVWPVPVDPTGVTGPTRGAAAGPGWRRSSKNLHVPSSVDALATGQRIAEAYARGHGRAAVTGWASLWLHRAAYFDGLHRDGRTRLAVPLLEAGARLRSTSEVQVLRNRVPEDELVARYGVRCTVVERALLDHLALLDDLREAVVAVDMAAAAQLTSLRRFGDYVARRGSTRGAPLARLALTLADENSASPQEPRFRMVWQLDAGWARPLVNRDVHDLDGRFLGRPDLLDPDRGIVGEFAGAVHRSRARHRRDVQREDLFRRAGLEYVEVVGADLDDVSLVVDRMEAAAARAGRQPRRWQLGPPPAPLDDLLDQREAMIALATEDQ